MRRPAACLGPARPLAEIVINLSDSLIAPSQEALQARRSVNGDGFGIAWLRDNTVEVNNDPGKPLTL